VHVVAATECEILVLGAADFYEVTAAYPALWAELEDVADRRARDHAGRLG
jgi:CRP-like cAMP-binding protein